MDDLSSKQLLPESEEHQERRHRRLNVDLDDTDIPLDSRRLCLKEWAGKANWKSGGAARGRIGKLPKAPMTAEDAYALYMQSQAVQHFKTESIDASNEGDDLNLIKHEAATEAYKTWNNLSDNERLIFEDIAKEDARRFQEQAVHYELLNPGWFAQWLQRRGKAEAGGQKIGSSGKIASAAAAGRTDRPKPPLTPWMAFLQITLDKVRQQEPEAVKRVSAIELMRLAMREASPVYKSLTPEEKAIYIKKAEEDKLRYEKELEAFPQYKAKLEARKARKALNKATKTQSRKPAAKRGSGKAGEEEKDAAADVDVTGLNPMQAWAAKERAKQRAALCKGAKPQRRTRQSTRAVTDAADEEEATPQAAMPAADEPAESSLPDDAYIRSRPTSDEDSSSEVDDVDMSDDDEVDSIQGDPSTVADTQADPQGDLIQETQDADDAGVLGRMRNVITAGLDWLTTARKRRGGLLSSMQEAPLEDPSQLQDGAAPPKRRAATPRKLEGLYGAAVALHSAPKRRRSLAD